MGKRKESVSGVGKTGRVSPTISLLMELGALVAVYKDP